MPRPAEPPVRVPGDAWRRLLLLADSHGEIAAPLLDVAREVDCVVHAGDIGAAVVLERLRVVAPWIAVRGNNDTAAASPVADRATLAALPAVASIALAGGDLVVLHGHQYPHAAQRHAALRRDHPAARAIVYGHSHKLVVDTARRPWVLNPGACGRARVGPGASGLLISIEGEAWEVALVGPFPPAPRRRLSA
ncbi:MAG: metallophosphoesterase family protein [Gammaproteobacteria bacterium]|nr:metallophosphoesterase family protein [Gammaproteobacteria bacterium]MBI5618132.1 metallophosphoesterase family protein [Gammaproteobacteria bacterium]